MKNILKILVYLNYNLQWLIENNKLQNNSSKKQSLHKMKSFLSEINAMNFINC